MENSGRWGLCLLVILGTATGIGWSIYIYYDTPVEGRVQERGRDIFTYYFTIGEDQYLCTEADYNKICVNSVVRFYPDLITVRDLTIITNACVASA